MNLIPKTSPNHLLHNFIDNQLTGQELETFQNRIQTDPGLAKQVVELQKVKYILSSLPLATVPRDFRLKPETVGVKPPTQFLTLFFQRSFFLFAFIFLTLFATDGIFQTTILQPVPMAVSAELAAPMNESMPSAFEAPMAAAPIEEPPADVMNKAAPTLSAAEPEARTMMVPDAAQDSVAIVESQPSSNFGFILQNRQAILFGFALMTLALLLFAQLSRKKMEMDWKNKYMSKDVG